MYNGLSTTPFNSFFVLQTDTRTRGHSSQGREKQMPFRLETAFLNVVDRCNGLDQCVIDSATVNSFQEWVTANATKQDGLLHGLIQSSCRVLQASLGSEDLPWTGATAPSKSPGTEGVKCVRNIKDYRNINHSIKKYKWQCKTTVLHYITLQGYCPLTKWNRTADITMSYNACASV